MEKLADVGEGLTKLLTVTFRDAQGDLVIPTSVLFTLSDSHGTIINGHDEDPLSGLASSMDVLLEGMDLELTADPLRVATFVYVYDSTEGTNLKGAIEVKFRVKDLRNYVAV